MENEQTLTQPPSEESKANANPKPPELTVGLADDRKERRGRRKGSKNKHPVPVETRLFNKIEASSVLGCWVWKGCVDDCGYGKFNYAGECLAHRAMWSFLNGDPGDLYVLHKCDNPPCVNPFHLFTGTQKENMEDCKRKGRKRAGQGEAQHNAKLTEEDVVFIRDFYSKNKTGPKIPRGCATMLSKRFGIHVQLISDIGNRVRGWKHVP